MIKKILIGIGVLILAGFVFLYGPVFEIIRYSSHAHAAKGATRDEIQAFLDNIFIFVPPLATIYFIFIAIAKKERRKASLWTAAGTFILVIAMVASMFISLMFKILMWEKPIEAGKPLIAAIVEYEKKNGKPPASLKQLVPDYIKSIPQTGMGAFPEFEYRTQEKVKKLPAPWELRIDLSGKKTDQFLYYWPKQIDPNFKKGVKYGKWQLMSEFEVAENWHYAHWLNTRQEESSDSSLF